MMKNVSQNLEKSSLEKSVLIASTKNAIVI